MRQTGQADLVLPQVELVHRQACHFQLNLIHPAGAGGSLPAHPQLGIQAASQLGLEPTRQVGGGQRQGQPIRQHTQVDSSVGGTTLKAEAGASSAGHRRAAGQQSGGGLKWKGLCERQGDGAGVQNKLGQTQASRWHRALVKPTEPAILDRETI